MRAGDEAFEALRETIDSLAAAEVSELVAEARIEARAKVRSILAEAMAQALLDRSQLELGKPLRSSGGPPRAGAGRETARPAGVKGETRRAGGERETARPAGQAKTRGRAESPVASPQPEPALPEQPVEGKSVTRGARAEASADELGWYVYCIVGDTGLDLPDSLAGVEARHRVRLLAEGDLAAVASQVPLSEFGEETLRESLGDVEWLERTARAHERVLDEVRALATVIPMRLCTIYRSESSVGQMLVRERQPLSEALARLAGKTEWGLKIFVDPSVVERAAKEASDDLARLDAELEEASAGGVYMRRKQLEGLLREEADRLVEECVEDAHSRLSVLAVEALRNPLQTREASGHDGQMVYNGVYLLEDAATGELHACVAALSDEYGPRGCDLQATGPWPPYNFVKSSIEAAW